MPVYLSHSTEAPADALASHGWWLGDSLFSDDLIQSLSKRAVELATTNQLTVAAVGRGVARQQLAAVRRDKIQWIDPDCDDHRAFLDRCEQLRSDLNRQLYLGIHSVEAHYAHYAKGGFYERHVDSFKGARNRMVSMVMYLNSGWQPVHQGELKLWNPAGDLLGVVAPRQGDTLLMLSEEMPHQVLPTEVDRYSIAAWYRC